jgi:hypothetical protein
MTDLYDSIETGQLATIGGRRAYTPRAKVCAACWARRTPEAKTG